MHACPCIVHGFCTIQREKEKRKGLHHFPRLFLVLLCSTLFHIHPFPKLLAKRDFVVHLLMSIFPSFPITMLSISTEKTQSPHFPHISFSFLFSRRRRGQIKGHVERRKSMEITLTREGIGMSVLLLSLGIFSLSILHPLQALISRYYYCCCRLR